MPLRHACFCPCGCVSYVYVFIRSVMLSDAPCTLRSDSGSSATPRDTINNKLNSCPSRRHQSRAGKRSLASKKSRSSPPSRRCVPTKGIDTYISPETPVVGETVWPYEFKCVEGVGEGIRQCSLRKPKITTLGERTHGGRTVIDFSSKAVSRD